MLACNWVSLRFRVLFNVTLENKPSIQCCLPEKENFDMVKFSSLVFR